MRRIDRVHVIVPVYRELKNGNLFRLLTMLQSQTLDPTRLQLTIIVNNNHDHAHRQSAIYLENQETLKYLQSVISRFSYSIRVVDHSTNGIETNMGILREIGVRDSLEGQKDFSRCVLVFMDADTTFVPNHFAKTSAALRKV